MRDIIDVSQLNRFAKSILAADDRMNDLIVCVEITNFKKQYSSGHCYFTLRDENSTVKCVMFSRSARLLDFAPEDGMMVLAYGSATIYERDGAFQYYVDYMRPYGIGAAQKAFDQLKAKLEKEGFIISINIDSDRVHYDADISLHGHFKCDKCKKIYDFKIDGIECQGLDGFDVRYKEVYYSGLCADCNR